MSEGDAILIAAQSARALAQAARRAGLRPFVLDLFGDEDTHSIAEAHRSLPGRFGEGKRGARGVLSGLDALADLAGGRTLGVVLGSGFEGAPALMAKIAERHRLIGAAPETVATLKDPPRFAALCANLAIPHPAIRLPFGEKPIPHPHPEVPAPAGLEGALQGSQRELERSFEARPRLAPQDEGVGGRGPHDEADAGWLLKRIGGSGGSHIRLAASKAVPPGHYAQAFVAGRAVSLNFLADGRDIAVLAFTAQWSKPSALRPFRFAGAIAPGRNEPDILPVALRNEVIEAVARIVAKTGLRGLASADLLVEGAQWWLLEINPRPGATLDVLDRRPTPLLASHIEASLGRLPHIEPAPGDAAGTEICYAARRYACIKALDWPDFSRDRPRAGTRVAKDAPLCTVTATGRNVQGVKNTLRERVRIIDALLEDREEFHVDPKQEPERQRSGDATRGAARR